MSSSIANVTSYLPSLPNLPTLPSIQAPTIDFASKIGEWCTIIGQQMNFIRQGIGVTRIVVGDIPYIITGKFLKEKTPFGIVGNLLLCFSDFGSILPFLDHWKVINLSHITGVIGRVRFLNPLMQIPVGTILSVVSCVGYVLFGIDAVYRLFQSDVKGPFKRQAWLDIANAVVQVTLSGLLIAGMTRLPILIPMGGVCLLVGSVCFLHRCFLPPEPGTEKKKIKNKNKNKKPEPIVTNAPKLLLKPERKASYFGKQGSKRLEVASCH